MGFADLVCFHLQIFGYRMSLWAEHIGSIEESFTRPESLECTRQVRHIGQQNWEKFISSHVTEMKGHLLKYPVSIHGQGESSVWVCHIPGSWREHLWLVPEHPRKPHNMSRAYRLPKSLRVTLTHSFSIVSAEKKITCLLLD
jgi:phospholipase D1/2